MQKEHVSIYVWEVKFFRKRKRRFQFYISGLELSNELYETCFHDFRLLKINLNLTLKYDLCELFCIGELGWCIPFDDTAYEFCIHVSFYFWKKLTHNTNQRVLKLNALYSRQHFDEFQVKNAWKFINGKKIVECRQG